MNWKTRLRAARLAVPDFKKKVRFAEAMGVSTATVTDWEKSVEDGGIAEMKGTNLTKACELLGISAGYLLSNTADKTQPTPLLVVSDTSSAPHLESHPHRRTVDFLLAQDGDTDLETGKIEYWSARGSCGGGFLNYETLPKGHLVKEIGFFHKYAARPGNLFAVYADGDSMADFIVDGDIVIFDKTKTTPASGKIFLIDHPEGLRIKRLRLGFDGSWVLESINQDKHKFPDERIPPDQLGLLKVCGQFVYRQGG